jgi:Fe2+ or Zn2+ uptake regulation protein
VKTVLPATESGRAGPTASAPTGGTIQVLESLQNRLRYRAVFSDYVDLLRARGVQVTAQRLAVLRAVTGEPHIAAEGVAEAVRREIGAISLQSVYDALNLLVTGGVIRRIQPAGSPARFECRTGDNHHHLICRTCGRIVDVDCAVGAAPCLAAADEQGYEIDEAEVAYWGRCPACVANDKPPVPASTRRTVAKRIASTSIGARRKTSLVSRPRPRR